MTKLVPLSDVADEMLQSILATPKRQRRLRSATFWDKFGFEKRTKDRVEQVRNALRTRSLILNIEDDLFGKESKDEWIILTYVAPEVPPVAEPLELPSITIPTPEDSWFSTMESREFESEREVEYYFIMPLIEHLGYGESDIAIGFRVQMFEGVKSVNKEADCVLFDGTSRSKDDALLLVEAKRQQKIITEDHVNQARSYALWLSTPYYLVTNGEDIQVHLHRGAVQSDVMLMSFKRNELRTHWTQLYQTISKTAVVAYKAKVIDILRALQ